jgi:DNA-directed RNA polymerase III subunit RPC6
MLQLLRSADKNQCTTLDLESHPDLQSDEYMTKAINALYKEKHIIFMHKDTADGAEPILVYVLNDKGSDGSDADLSQPERFVLQVISKSGNMGIWTKDIRSSTGLPTMTLTKVYKSLESKRLVKTVKSVAAKSKKLYMMYDTVPAKELTGGPWYTEHEFDHEFINELRNVVLQLISSKQLAGGIGIQEITKKLKDCGISKIELSEADVDQLVTTCVLDGDVVAIKEYGDDADWKEDSVDGTLNKDKMYTMARPGPNSSSSNFNFKYWECLATDFHFRPLKFGDLGLISAHEPHHHSC